MCPKLFSRVQLTLALVFLASTTPGYGSPPSHLPHVAPPVVGVVVDSSGTPLPNARVVLAGLKRATTTDADGAFRLSAVPPGTHHLDVSLIGYAPEHVEVNVPQSGPDVRIRIVLVPTPLALEGLVVTGTPSAADPLNVSQSTVQLTGAALERSLGASIAQTIATQPGIQVRYNGPATTPVIRGLSGERVLVLENGERTGDLSSSSPDHALSVDPLAATRIEVVRGPASLLYGSSALGGVVNVIGADIPNSVPGHVEGYLASQVESVTPGGAATAEVTLPVSSNVAVLARLGGRSVGDVRLGGSAVLENSYLQNQHGDLGVGYVGERVSGGVAASAYRFDYGLPFAPTAEETGIHIEGWRREVKGRAEIALSSALLTDVHVDGTAQWYTHDEVESNGEVGTQFDLRTQTLNLSGSTGFFNARGTLGAAGLFKQYDATGEEALTPAVNSRSFGLFGYQELPLFGRSESAPRLQAGARYDVYRLGSQDGQEKFGPGRTLDFSAFSGSLGAIVPLLHERVSLSTSVARAFRAPSVEELFSNAFHAAVGTFDVGNPALKAETNLGVEGVLRAQSRRVNAQFSAYYNRIDNYIFPRIVGDTLIEEEGASATVPLNRFAQADADLRGAEGKIEAVVARNVVAGVLGDIVRGEFVGGSPLPYMPAAHLGALARWDNARLSVGAEVRHGFEQDRVALDARTRTPVETPTDSYTLLGLNVGYSRIAAGRVHTVTLRADNLLDEVYRDATSRIKDFAPSPGRNLTLVYRVLF